MVFTRPRVGTRPEPRRQPQGPARAPTRSQSGPLIASPAGLLHIQQTAGNAAATAFVQRQPGGAVASERRTLRFGSTGEDVKQLQMKLGRIRERMHDRDPDENARIDGIFGPLTRQDVIDFQTDTGLDADGVVGPKSWDALDSLVPGTPDQGQEVARREQNDAALALLWAGQYDAALPLFEALLAAAQSPETIGVCWNNIGTCHQQRGRFGLAVTSYEHALAGRFNQEGMRQVVLDELMKARSGVFLSEPAPDPEPLPPGADAAAVAGREGGGVTERQPAKSGDSGPSVDLFKGKLAHMMVAWESTLPDGDVFESKTEELTGKFQQACGLPQSGEADSSTWHALDSFTRADVPYSVVGPLIDRAIAAEEVGFEDPSAALPLWEAIWAEARSLGLVEFAKKVDSSIGREHHKLSHFPEAVARYESYLKLNIPEPSSYGYWLELLRRAHRGTTKE